MQNKPKHKINLFTLIMISSAIVVSIRNFPTEAETGLHMIFFALVAAIGFFVPVALVSAELATGWPKQGGIYAWVKEAFGDRLGFVGIWLQWTYMIIGSIAMLYFIGGSLAFLFAPSMAHNKYFLFAILMIIVWGATLFSFRGIKASGMVSTICFLGGVLIPGILIISLGLTYVLKGNPIQISMSLDKISLIPDMSRITSLVILVGFIRAFTGIEVSSSHANEVTNPTRNYPIAIFVVVILGFLLNILGSFSVAAVVPQKHISLLAGLMQAYHDFFHKFNMGWIVPIVGIMIAAGAIGEISTWTLGPVRGIHASAKNGELPPFFQKVNDNGIPTHLLIVQASFISLVGGGLLFMPNLNTSFWMSNVLAVLIYIVMYSLMLLAGIRLRYKKADAARKYRIPGRKNLGMWAAVLTGLATLTFCFLISFLPPDQLKITHKTLYVFLLILGFVVLVSVPFVVYRARRPAWRIVNSEREESEL